MAFQVKSKSAEVIGDPSAQTALSLMWNRTVNGVVVRPPLSRVGTSRNSGEATNLPFASSCMALGRTCSRTVYQVQRDDEHSLMGLMHLGHCSAPNTSEPTCSSRRDDGAAVGFGATRPVQAVAAMATTAATQTLWRPIGPPS